MTCAILTRTLGGILLDAVIQESHQSTLEIAKHPVERSADVSDHAWRNPRVVTIEGVINQPGHMAGWEALLQIQRLAEPFPIVTGLRVYNDMLIQDLQATRDATHSRVLHFTATCQEVIRVGTQATVGEGGPGTAVSRGMVQARPLEATNAAQSSKLGSLGG